MGWVVEKMHRTMKRTAAAPPIFIPKWFLSKVEVEEEDPPSMSIVGKAFVNGTEFTAKI